MRLRRYRVAVLITRIDHVGIAVTDLDAAVEHYRATFGLLVVSVETNLEQGVREAMLRVGEAQTPQPDDVQPAWLQASQVPPASYVQLLEPLGPDTPVGKFLANRGEGVHHIGYAVDDVAAAMETLTAQGIRVLDERPRHGSLGTSIAFAHPKDLYGVLTELVQTVRD
ncbi:MAG: methylmalonyl-CoA/ethylmalonyl-CoA epimerase [Actinomycetota bacterium]|jgi:methylmalonyl-CoA/ethylmalonyl-CoA epimerase|nr:methylmalonyl-CoA/ethylmalonyl-CoA epimerase [Actinomycetota bacterium]